jgi:signal transduction histidine kinase
MRPKRPRWHLIYFVLAGFDLLTISVSLFLNHRLVGIYTESVEQNQEWAERLERYSTLAQTANEVNATANDVFETRDVAAESAKMRAALATFGEEVAAARTDLQRNVTAGQAADLLDPLDVVSTTMAAQVAEGEQVFAFFDRAEFDRAGECMARMDRQHARLNTALGRLRGEVARIQSDQFRQQMQLAATLRGFEYAIAGAIVLMVAGVTVYGTKLYQQVVAATQAKEQQLAVVSQIATGVAHELRNPLTSVKMLVQSNREEAVARGMPAEDLRIIEQEIRRMERCLRTFLDFARPPRPERKPFDLCSLVDRTFSLIEGQAAKQCVVVKADTPRASVVVNADWEQIQQLLLNLTLNALDAMPTGGTLSVSVARSDGHVELRVADTGPGIAPQLVPRLFEPFETTKETGVGLGLVVSRRIAQDHGGSLTASNRAEGGACFVLRLPASAGENDDDAHVTSGR